MSLARRTYVFKPASLGERDPAFHYDKPQGANHPDEFGKRMASSGTATCLRDGSWNRIETERWNLTVRQC